MSFRFREVDKITPPAGPKNCYCTQICCSLGDVGNTNKQMLAKHPSPPPFQPLHSLHPTGGCRHIFVSPSLLPSTCALPCTSL